MHILLCRTIQLLIYYICVIRKLKFVVGDIPILHTCTFRVFIYIILFGFNICPFFELVNWTTGAPPPLHACSCNATDIRREVESLKTNFNNRMKQILFSAILNAYYAGFIPCCFAQVRLFWTKKISCSKHHFSVCSSL